MRDINLNINLKIILKKDIYKKDTIKKAKSEKNNCLIIVI
jgi:hypothetical protein